MSYLMYDLMEGLASIIAISLAIYLVIAFVLVYFAADGQARRSGGARDPMLGARVGTTFLLTLCLQVALLGLTTFLGGILEDAGEGVIRMGLGMTLGAMVAAIFPFFFHRGSVAKASGGARDFVTRKALGINAILAGVAATVLVIALVATLVSGARFQAMVFAAIVVYGGATAVLFLRLAAPPEAEPTAL